MPKIIDLSLQKKWRSKLAIIKHIPLLAEKLGRDIFDEELSKLSISLLKDKVFAIRDKACENLMELAAIFGLNWVTEFVLPALTELHGDGNYLRRMTFLFTVRKICEKMSEIEGSGYLEACKYVADSILPLILILGDDPVANVRFNVALTLQSIRSSLDLDDIYFNEESEQDGDSSSTEVGEDWSDSSSSTDCASDYETNETGDGNNTNTSKWSQQAQNRMNILNTLDKANNSTTNSTCLYRAKNSSSKKSKNKSSSARPKRNSRLKMLGFEVNDNPYIQNYLKVVIDKKQQQAEEDKRRSENRIGSSGNNNNQQSNSQNGGHTNNSNNNHGYAFQNQNNNSNYNNNNQNNNQGNNNNNSNNSNSNNPYNNYDFKNRINSFSYRYNRQRLICLDKISDQNKISIIDKIHRCLYKLENDFDPDVCYYANQARVSYGFTLANEIGNYGLDGRDRSKSRVQMKRNVAASMSRIEKQV